MATAREYLEKLQREAQAMSPIEVETLAIVEKKKANLDFERRFMESIGITDRAEIEKARKEIRQSVREAKKTIPTPLEDFNSHLILRSLAIQLEKVTRQLKIDLPTIPVYGSLPLGSLNARAILVPGSKEHLIAFQDGVFGLVNLVTKAVAASFPVKGGSADGDTTEFGQKLREFKWGWRKNKEPLERLAEFLYTYLVFGNAKLAEQYFIQSPFDMPALMMRESFELFLFGHELGHIIAGHLDGPFETHHQMIGATEVATMDWDWDREFEADAIGMRLALQGMLNNGFDFGTGYYGIDMAFSAMEIVDLATSMLVDGEARTAPSSKSHPRHAVRREFLRQLLRQQIGKKAAKRPIKLAKTMEEVLHQMWGHIAPKFKELHLAGERPLPIWSPRQRAVRE